MLMFITVAVAEFNILRTVNLDNPFVILAVSLAAGLGVTFLPESLEQFPPAVQSVLESGIATGSICALVLNIVMPKPKEESLTAVKEAIAAESNAPHRDKEGVGINKSKCRTVWSRVSSPLTSRAFATVL